MKYKDYFLKLKETGEINNEEYNKFIETVGEGEIPDAVFQVLDSTFLTVKRAQTHPGVISKIKADTLSPIDRDIKEVLKFLPAEKVIDIEREQSTFKKMEMIKEALPEAFDKAKKAPNDDEIKKKLSEKDEIVKNLTEKFNKLEASKTDEIKKIKDQSAAEMKDYKLLGELEKSANSYTFAEVFKDARPHLTKAILSEIRSKNKLDLSEKEGQYAISVLDDTGAPRFENNGNTPVTISSLLDAAFKPYLKVNNQDPQQQQQNQHKTESFRVDPGKAANRTGANVSVQV